MKRLREALGWNQADFARSIDRSIQSVQGYERGRMIPQDVIEKMKSLATRHGLADLALELSSEEWQVRRVFHPGETIISQPQRAGSSPAPQSTRPRDRALAHRLLDEIYDSGNSQAIDGICQNLSIFSSYVRLSVGPPRASKKRP